MTHDALDATHAAQWRHAASAIDERLDDAYARARIGDLAGAVARLVRLGNSLLGPDGSGIMGDARAAFYRDAHRQYDPEIHDPAVQPTPAGAKAARTLLIGGTDARRELAVLLDQARIDLTTMFATTDDGDNAARRAALDAWLETWKPRLKSWARSNLSDAQMTLHWAVGRLMEKPEYRTT